MDIRVDDAIPYRGKTVGFWFWRNSASVANNNSNWTVCVEESPAGGGNFFYSIDTVGISNMQTGLATINENTCTKATAGGGWTGWFFKNEAGNTYYHGTATQNLSNTGTCTNLKGYTSGSVGANPVYTWVE